MSYSKDLVMVMGSLQKIAQSAVSLHSKQLDAAMKNSSVFNDAIPKPPETEKGSKSESSPLDVDPIELVQKTAFLTENAVIFANAATNKWGKRAKQYVGLSAKKPFESNYKLHKLDPLGETSQRETGSPADAESKVDVTSALGEDVDPYDYEDEEEEEDYPIEYKYVVNPRKTSMDLINSVEDFTDRSALFSSAFMAVPVSTKKPAYKSTFVPRKFGVISDQPFDNVFQRDGDGARTRSVPKCKKPLSSSRPKSQLSAASKERSVPSSRVSRFASFTSLGVGLGVGMVAEASRRAVGIRSPSSGDGGSKLDGSIILSEANVDRIVETLCSVRGAALKIGQILSIQDEALINPQLAKMFDRVRQSADFMPMYQLESTMVKEFGDNWRSDKFAEFEDKPFAAASIGQVHAAKLKDGRSVAVKIQYPGVAQGIESDISNLMGLLKVAKILPEGLFIDTVIKHLKVEMAQECDYEREAECCRKMRAVLEPYQQYYVPEVVDEASTKMVFTSELIEGLTIDQCAEQLDQETRDEITHMFLELLLRELFILGYMQTDPNWANFLYNPDTKQLGLLDFGATREYRPFFVNNYFRIIDGAANGDREAVLEYSRKVGFLTGYESTVMNEAHVESVMILGEAFRNDVNFSFGKQRTTHRMQELVPVMLKHRLCAPPAEVYSLHRKMSGLFLMATKLKSEINCYQTWRTIAREFEEKQKIERSALNS